MHRFGDHHQRLLFNNALLFWLLGVPAHFPCQSKFQVGQSLLMPPPLVLKPPSQAAVLGVDADATLRQVKPGKGKVQSHNHNLGMRLVRVQWLGAKAR